MATRRFCGMDDYDQLGRNQFKEAFYALIGSVSHDTKVRVSKMLAQNGIAPRAAAFYLAFEDLEIAKPVLESIRLLGQLDLVQIVEKAPISHARVVATRPDLGRAMISRLRKFGDDEIEAGLDTNFAIAKPVEIQVVGTKGPKLSKRRITYSVERTSAPDQKGSANETAQQSLLAAASRGGRLKGSQAAIQPKPAVKVATSSKLSFAKRLEEAALHKNRQSMAVAMQDEFKLAMKTCHQVLEDKSGDTLAVLMKAAEIPSEIANRITLPTFPMVGLSVRNASRAVAFYGQLNTETSREAVAQWPKQAEKTAAHQTTFSESEKPARVTSYVTQTGQNVTTERTNAGFRKSA